MSSTINTTHISISSELNKEQIEVLEYKDWRQRIELSPGFFTPGHITPDIWEMGKLPANLSGKSFLEIGSNDGMFSFLAEMKGATEIFATDLYKDGIDTMKNGWDSTGIKLLKKYLNSKIQIQNLSVYDIEKLNRKFDVVFCNNVIAWLDDIPKAIKLMSDTCSNTLIINDGFLKAMDEYPILRYETNAPYPYRPNVRFIKEIFKENGFKKVTVNKIDSYSLFLKQTRIFPLVKLNKGSNQFLSPVLSEPFNKVSKDTVVQATGYCNNRFYIKSLGWIDSKEVVQVPYASSVLAKTIKTLLRDELYEKFKSKIVELKDEVVVLSVIGEK